MDKPLEDPVFEAAAQINFAYLRNHPKLYKTTIDTVQDWIVTIPRQCHLDMLTEAARQIDALRAAGLIPEKTNDQT